MNYAKIFFKRLSGRAKLLLLVYFLMALGLITFLTSPFIWIWAGWSIAWRVGATGLCATVGFFVCWWVLYNTYSETEKLIKNN